MNLSLTLFLISYEYDPQALVDCFKETGVKIEGKISESKLAKANNLRYHIRYAFRSTADFISIDAKVNFEKIIKKLDTGILLVQKETYEDSDSQLLAVIDLLKESRVLISKGISALDNNYRSVDIAFYYATKAEDLLTENNEQ